MTITLRDLKDAMRQTLLANQQAHGTHLMLSTSSFIDDPFEPVDHAADAFAAGVAERLALIAPNESEDEAL